MEQTRDFSLYNLLAVFLLMPLFPSPPTALSINYSSKRIFIERFYSRKEEFFNGGYKTAYSITPVQKLLAWDANNSQSQKQPAKYPLFSFTASLTFFIAISKFFYFELTWFIPAFHFKKIRRRTG